MIYSAAHLQLTKDNIKFNNSSPNININNNIINNNNNNINNCNNKNTNNNVKINIKTTSIMNQPPVKRRGGPREGAGRKRKNGPKALTYTPTPEVAQFLNCKKQCNESIQQIITRCILEFKMLEATDIKHRDEVSQLWSQIFTLEQNLCQCKQELKEYKEKCNFLCSLKHHRIESGNTDILISPIESSSLSTVDSLYNEPSLLNVKTSTPISSVNNSYFNNENSSSAGENNILSNNICNSNDNKNKGNIEINNDENLISDNNKCNNEINNSNSINQKHSLNFRLYNESENLFKSNTNYKDTNNNNSHCSIYDNENNYSSEIPFSSSLISESSSIESSKTLCHKTNDDNKIIVPLLDENNNKINNNYYQVSKNKLDNNNENNNNYNNNNENYKLFSNNISSSDTHNNDKNYNNNKCYNFNKRIGENSVYCSSQSKIDNISKKDYYNEHILNYKSFNDNFSYMHKNQDKEKEINDKNNYCYDIPHPFDNNQQKYKKIKVENN
ncbi:hypothetical protein PIROE2DRAFT_4489, partial [Piromyces sp. E2]